MVDITQISSFVEGSAPRKVTQYPRPEARLRSTLDVIPAPEDRKQVELLREQLSEDLGRKESYLAEGQRLSFAGSWSFKPDLTCDYWSRELYEILGFDPREGIPTVPAYLTRVHPADREVVEASLQRMVVAGEGCDLKQRIILTNGVQRVIRCVGIPIRENGVVTRFVVTLMDITEQEELTQDLWRSKAHLVSAQRLSHTGAVGMDVSTGRIFWSDEAARIYGYPPGTEPTPELILQRVHPDDVDRLTDVLARASAGGANFDYEHRLLMPDGSIKHIYNLAESIRDESGHEEVLGAITDITEHRLAEAAIRRSEAYLAEAQRLSHTGSFGWNVSSGEIYWSDETFRLFEFDPTTKVTTDLIMERTHPNDRLAVQQVIERASNERTEFALEHRLLMPDGSIKHLQVVGHPSTDDGGRSEFVGAVTDITDHRLAEESIRAQEAELRQIVELVPQHIGVYAPDGSPLYANHTALEYFGISMDEWVAECTRLALIHPDDREQVQNEKKKLIRECEALEFEARLRRHDGKFRCFLFRLSPIKDERGGITRWYSAGTDIEDRKRAEEEIRKENIALREEIIKASMFEEIVGYSPALQNVLKRVAKVAPTDSTVLITGETGTGKELIARAIHKSSKRCNRAFMSVNCAAIPQSLIPSELFGHEKGAFTGATARRLGRFELAEGGTIFLDEVGELPQETQLALLRVLQEQEFERVGGSRSIKSNVRVIVATNRDLQAAMAAGTFREDLFYRLNVFPIEVPALRERREDIPMLVQYFIDRYARELGKNIRTVSKETLDLFDSYTWPGNIRELRNVIERSIIVCDTESFSVDESWLSRQPLPAQPTGKLALRQRLADQEREAIEAALTESRGRVFGPAGAAARLGIARSTLESKIRTLKIDKNRFKICKATLRF